MSAYVLDEGHIDAIVTVAIEGPAGMATGRREPDWRFMDWHYNGSRFGSDNAALSEADCLGRMLLAENVKSVSHRYPNDPPDELPGPVPTPKPTDYFYRRGVQPNVLEAFKLLACYDYQSCETTEWRDSMAAKFCQRLQLTLIGFLPGYEEAAGWENTDKFRRPDEPQPTAEAAA